MISDEEYQENKTLAGKALDDDTRYKLGDRFDFRHERISLVWREEGLVLGRLVGTIFFNCLHIEMLVVNEGEKGKGIGRKLLQSAEARAIALGCHFCHLESMSFNAPAFYLKHGYTLMQEVQNSPLSGETHNFFIKYFYVQPA